MKLLQLISIVVVTFGIRYAFAGEFNSDGIRISFPGEFTERKIASPEGSAMYVLSRHYGSGSPQEVISVSIHIQDISSDSEAQQRIKRSGAAYESAITLAVAVRNVLGFPEFKLLKDIRHFDISGAKVATAAVSYSGSYADPVWKARAIDVTIYCLTESTREIEFQVFALPDAPNDLVSSTIEAIENARLKAL